MSRYARLPDTFDTDDAKNGMAYFEGTGPEGKTCGTCGWRGYHFTLKKTNPRTGKWITVFVKSGGCRKFRALTGRNGPVVQKTWRACKYYGETRL